MSGRRKKRRRRLYVAHKTLTFYFLALHRKKFPALALEDSSANVRVSPCPLNYCILKTMYIGSSVPISNLFFFLILLLLFYFVFVPLTVYVPFLIRSCLIFSWIYSPLVTCLDFISKMIIFFPSVSFLCWVNTFPTLLFSGAFAFVFAH